MGLFDFVKIFAFYFSFCVDILHKLYYNYLDYLSKIKLEFYFGACFALFQKESEVYRMNDSLFRKKSLDRISSPDQLNDYIKVSNPSIWLIIGALLILATSFSVWSFNGNITSEVSCTGAFQSSHSNIDTINSVVCYVDANYSSKIADGMPVRIYDRAKPMSAYIEGKVVKVSSVPVCQADILGTYSSEFVADSILEAEYGVQVLIKVSKTADGSFAWANSEIGDETFVRVDGLCKVDIITESYTPVEFLFNKTN